MPRRDGDSHLPIDIAMFILIFVTFLYNMLVYVNYSKEISIVEDKISATKKSNAETLSLIENQISLRESLKKNVDVFAKSRGMTTPTPGQVVVITDEDWQRVPSLTTARQKSHVEKMAAANALKKGNDAM